MAGKRNVVFFDLDGTLTDPAEGITNCVAYALREMGRAIPGRKTLYRFIGPPLVYGFREWFGMSEEEALTATEKYRERFRGTGIFENKIYGGVKDMLKQLRSAGLRIYMATSKPTEFARRIAEHFGIDGYFEDIVGSGMNDHENGGKGVIIARALAVSGAGREDVVMVGDRRYDAEGARQNGVAFIGVSYGYAEPGELEAAGAETVCATVDELRRILLEGDAG